jgi:hypothetical protein
MRDSDVRAAVIDWLGTKYGPETRIVEEMGIWSGSVRVDIAVINGELQGFELKSERDTLVRLESQADLYNQVFDRVTLVAAKRHLEKAIDAVPRWWGIACATMTPNGATFRLIRRARRNPAIHPVQLARLLWRAEALEILVRHGYSRGFRRKNVDVIATRLAEVLSLKELAKEVRDALKRRPEWLGQPVGHERQMAIGHEASPD